MNNFILEYFRNLLTGVSGNYFELGSDQGKLVSILSNEFTNKVFISVDGAVESAASVMRNIFDHANVLFYSMPALEFNQTLTDSTAQAHDISVVFINHGTNYEDLAEGVKVAQRLIGVKPGYVIFNNVAATTIVIDEFKQLLGYRIVAERIIADDVVSFQLREQ